MSNDVFLAKLRRTFEKALSVFEKMYNLLYESIVFCVDLKYKIKL